MSVIGNEFSGLPMDQLIGAPLKAACDAQVNLAKASADFINTVGFTPELGPDNKPTGKVVPRQVEFSFWQPLPVSQRKIIVDGKPATGTVKLSGSSGSVDSIKIKGTEILGTSVTAGTTPEATATAVVTQITKCQSKYLASASGDTITITAPSGTGSSLNNTPIEVKTTDLTFTNSDMSGGTDADTMDAGGETQVQKVVLSVPFLSIVNVPSLMVKTVNITFDMEVKSSESHQDESSQEGSLDATAKVGWGPFSAEVKVHGSVSSHQENTRSTDRSAKYHVDVQARDDGMPEGLSRVLDMLQKSIAPVSVSKPVALKDAQIAQNQKAIA